MASGLEAMIFVLKEAGFTLILLWLLTLAIVYGLLSHAGMPKSVGVRAVIAIVCAFLVLLAAAASPAVAFIQNLIVSSVLIAFGLLLVVIFLEIGGVQIKGQHVVAAHPKFFGAIILLVFVGVFIGLGGPAAIGFPDIEFDDTIMAVGLFALVMIAAIWFMYKEVGGDKKE